MPPWIHNLRLSLGIFIVFLMGIGVDATEQVTRQQSDPAPRTGTLRREYKNPGFLQGCPRYLAENVVDDSSGTLALSWKTLLKRVDSPNKTCSATGGDSTVETSLDPRDLENYVEDQQGLANGDGLTVSSCVANSTIKDNAQRNRVVGDYYYKLTKIQSAQMQMIQMIPTLDMLLGEKTTLTPEQCEDPILPETQRWCRTINSCDYRNNSGTKGAFEKLATGLHERYLQKKALQSELNSINAAFADVSGAGGREINPASIQAADINRKKAVEKAIADIDAEDPWLAKNTKLSEACRRLGCDNNIENFRNALKEQLRADRKQIINQELRKARSATECVRSASGYSSGENRPLDNSGRSSGNSPQSCKGEPADYLNELPSPNLEPLFADVKDGSSPQSKLAKHYFTERFACISEQRRKVSAENQKWQGRAKMVMITAASMIQPYTMFALTTMYHSAAAFDTCRNPIQKMVGVASSESSRQIPEVMCPKLDDRPTGAARNDYDQCVSHLQEAAMELAGVGVGALAKGAKSGRVRVAPATARKYKFRGIEQAELTEKAENELGRALSQRESEGLYDAHVIGRGTNTKGNYTQAQINEKMRKLEEIGFSKEERRRLMERGIAGDDYIPTPRTTYELATRRGNAVEFYNSQSKMQFMPGDNVGMRMQTFANGSPVNEYTYTVRYERMIDGNGLKPDEFLFSHPDGMIRATEARDQLRFELIRRSDGEVIDVTERIRSIEVAPPDLK